MQITKASSIPPRGSKSHISKPSPEHSKASGSSKSSGRSKPTGKPTQQIYVDGSSINNGKSDAKASWATYFGKGDGRNQNGRVTGEQTNNRAELTAIKHALDHVQDKDKFYVIYTDSQYSLAAIKGPQKMNGHKIGPPKHLATNQDLVTNIQTLLKDFHLKGYRVELSKVKGHSNIYGNVQADLLARKSANNG